MGRSSAPAGTSTCMPTAGTSTAYDCGWRGDEQATEAGRAGLHDAGQQDAHLERRPGTGGRDRPRAPAAARRLLHVSAGRPGECEVLGAGGADHGAERLAGRGAAGHWGGRMRARHPDWIDDWPGKEYGLTRLEAEDWWEGGVVPAAIKDCRQEAANAWTSRV